MRSSERQAWTAFVEKREAEGKKKIEQKILRNFQDADDIAAGARADARRSHRDGASTFHALTCCALALIIASS